MTDPVLRAIVTEEALTREPLWEILQGLGGCLGSLSAETRAQRGDMARQSDHPYLRRTRARPRRWDRYADSSSWEDTADALTDAITGLLLAPVTPRRSTSEENPT